jgi:Mn2+/Fe2+ NRAMP family transporter
MKTVMVVMLVLVIAALASAGLFMLRGRDGKSDERQMARALAVRVGLSVALFLFVLLSWAMGWIKPGGLPIGH